MPISLLTLTSLALVACDRTGGSHSYERRTAIEGAEAAAADRLSDPSSAQFRNISVHNGLACGEVRATDMRRSSGQFVRFIATRDEGKWSARLEAELDRRKRSQTRFHAQWQFFCERRPR